MALGYLFKHRAGKHDPILISTLVKVLGIYPPGTLVKLSCGDVAKVMVTTSQVKKTIVWSCSLDGKSGQLRFLTEEEQEIVGVIKLESFHLLQSKSSIPHHQSAFIAVRYNKFLFQLAQS